VLVLVLVSVSVLVLVLVLVIVPVFVVADAEGLATLASYPLLVVVADAAAESSTAAADARISVMAPSMIRLRIGLLSPSWSMSACVDATVSSISRRYSSSSESALAW